MCERAPSSPDGESDTACSRFRRSTTLSFLSCAAVGTSSDSSMAPSRRDVLAKQYSPINAHYKATRVRVYTCAYAPFLPRYTLRVMYTHALRSDTFHLRCENVQAGNEVLQGMPLVCTCVCRKVTGLTMIDLRWNRSMRVKFRSLRYV